MRNVPPGWATDLAVLELTGSNLDDRGDHLVVRTPDNPGFHWGNFVLVTDPSTADDAERWVRTFAAAHPAATWTAVGLVAAPADPSQWQALGMALDVDEALTTRARPVATQLPDGYVVAPFDRDAWAQSVERAVADNAWEDPVTFRAFAERRAAAWRLLTAGGTRRSSGSSPPSSSWPSSGSCAAAGRPATSTSAPRPGTGGEGSLDICSAWPRSGRRSARATAGSSSQRPTATRGGCTGGRASRRTGRVFSPFAEVSAASRPPI